MSLEIIATDSSLYDEDSSFISNNVICTLSQLKNVVTKNKFFKNYYLTIHNKIAEVETLLEEAKEAFETEFMALQSQWKNDPRNQ